MYKKRTEKGNEKEMVAAKYFAISPVSTKSSSKIISVKPSNLHCSNTGTQNKQPVNNGGCTARNLCPDSAGSQKFGLSEKQRAAKLSPSYGNVCIREKPSSDVVAIDSNITFKHLTELQMTKACDDQLEELFKVILSCQNEFH